MIIRGGPPTHTRIIARHMAAPLIGQLTRHEIEMTEVMLLSVFFHNISNWFFLLLLIIIELSVFVVFQHEWEYYGDDQRGKNTVPWEYYHDNPGVNRTVSQADFTWKHFGDDSRPNRAVSREDFLNVLYDVHYILIKATHGNIMRQSR